MDKLIASFSQQLTEALKIGASFHFSAPQHLPANVVISGLGGSGIGGTIVENYAFPDLKIPLLVNKNYFLPGFINEDSLVIICSYSGNTEETIAAFEKALEKNARILCITSGGKIAEMADKNKIDCILIPGGMPPRACLGYSLVQILFGLRHFSVISGAFRKELEQAIALLDSNEDAIRTQAQALADKVNGKISVIYADSRMEGVAVRWRQQINENSKMLGWEGVLPEMNHNELVGWRDKDDELAVIFLRNDNDYARVQTRIELNKNIVRKCTDSVFEVFSKGSSYFERAFYLIHLGDWLSWYLAELRHVDATEVKVIDYLKGALAEQ